MNEPVIKNVHGHKSSGQQVKVLDRSAFETTDAETKVVKPSGLQSKIEELVKSYNKGRCSSEFLCHGAHALPECL